MPLLHQATMSLGMYVPKAWRGCDRILATDIATNRTYIVPQSGIPKSGKR